MRDWKIRGNWLEYTVGEQEAGLDVETLLKGRLSVSGRMLQRLTRRKGIFLNRKQPFLKRKVKLGDEVKVLIGDRAEASLPPAKMDLSILFEDDAVLVLNKPAGIAVHPVHPGQHHTLANGIAHYWHEKGIKGAVRPLHRLDKNTSGAILFAGNSFIHQLLDKQLREHSIQRVYYALISGMIGQTGETGTFNSPIGREKGHPVRRCIREDGDPAVTHYRVVECFPSSELAGKGGATLVEIQLETGRTHQIRVHFSSNGYPLIGDALYGGLALPAFTRQALHAASLMFCHPVTGEEVECRAPLPSDLEELIHKLRS
ncbi:RluA family pseudouridine synthase [Aneurinibacillus sp. Ricciae_BoGa-3]|uniref:RluA family pseudouridine synthase n=1 Tax=Aneurinibacillus sp. Ricciae_BoGa-3 TaxID=3022697 RepID=UPI0023427A87|nr:RluA family pseudouridine synthase [Aneurinibacillus sp. Ricciae_BoGa-3]WCK54391.1 RluA family pseudouridine synthase [Aneurinibacillus sp. Ricciae_BoGa-3]